MVTEVRSPEPQATVIYPDSDGQPMADNTQQFALIVWIKENLERVYAPDPNVFVAGDLLWYPVEGNNKLRQAPDVMVAFGRPKGYRGSYQQWKEENIPPQVVFEIWSPGNRPSEMAKKLAFYQNYGVEEYYLYHPDLLDLAGWCKGEEGLQPIEQMDGWVSPRLGVRFQMADTGLQLYRPDGEPFLTTLELEERALQAEERARQAESELERERQKSQVLADRLRSMGIDPDEL
ncbi:Uma2 family endonuclease [Laspinema palackyanum]|uniref:Uma2 family endonuclease n=1 Tax=Laspinema palackyanum TaxID=3231601 RepID=UPI00345CB61C|nr:Uma2 family endonuclease [Laspinema sp. D2c]